VSLDILKVIVVIAAIFYLNLKIKKYLSASDCLMMNVGLSLILFSSVLDYTDDLARIEYFPIFGRKAYLHDVLEDQFGWCLGFSLFVFGVFRSISRRKK